ncbi:MAG: FtsX-like permease family protein [Candidatus Dormibacteraeota bacterium]|nr:FtsX-like permease family protein [Candidatus Dormibacteraeota bacterium]
MKDQPPSKRGRTVLRNATRFVLGGALRDWRRHLGANSTAIGSITLLLLLAGVVGLGAVGLRGIAQEQVQSADVLHVYLRQGASQSQVAQLRTRLESDPMVVRVGYTSQAQALKKAEQRPGLSGLARGSGQNPFPASLDVTVKNLADMGPVADLAQQSAAVDPALPTSYDESTYQRVFTGLVWAAVGGGAFLLLLAVIAVAVTQNSIRAAIYTRRDEVRVMQLVGARRWMVRGPFLVEGALTGLIGGLVAAVVITVGGEAAVHAAAVQNQVLAPGVDQYTVLITGGVLLAAGLLLGAGGSLVALRRHLER